MAIPNFETCPQCGRDAVTEGVCGFCGYDEMKAMLAAWRDPAFRLIPMTASQATDALTEAALLGAEQDLTFRGLYLGRRKLAQKRIRIALQHAMPHLPSVEQIKHVGVKAARESLRVSIIGDLVSAGIIIMLFTIVPALAWSVLVSVIAGLLIHWILTQQKEYGLIQQARG